MVIEILSKSSKINYTHRKFWRYKNAGVPEYLDSQPGNKNFSNTYFERWEYITRVYDETDNIPVHVLDGCQIVMPEVFGDIIQL